MPLSKLQFRPGINRESTTYANEGGFYSCDKVRFRSGFPEKLGGWVNQNATYTYKGIARSLWNWVTYDSQNLLGVGTSQKYYIENGGEFFDITPLRTTVTLGTDPFTTVNGSKAITVTANAHGVATGTYVTFTNAGGNITVGGLVLASIAGVEFEVVQVPNSNSYIIVSATAASSSATGGGSAISAKYQINAGNSQSVPPGGGWGAGAWPSFTVTTLTDPFTASGSGVSVLTVTHSAHGLNTGDYVFFASIATDPCGINKTVMQQAFEITKVDANSYTISTVIGNQTYTTTSGTASGGSVVVDVPSTPVRGWGDVASSTAVTFLPMRLWSQDNFEQDLIISPRGEALYYWVKDTTTYARAVLLSSVANDSTLSGAMTIKTGSITSGTSTLTVTDSFNITAGSVVTGTGIPAGTYVLTTYTGGSSVPLSANATSTGTGATYTFSYPGRFVPNKSNYVLASDTSHFTIALGANPYDPTDFDTTFDPLMVRWSDQDNPFDWVPTTFNQSGEQHISKGSYLVTARDTRQEILVWTDAALFSMQYLGPPYVWGFNMLMDNISIASPEAAITVNGVTYWMGVDKFYMYSGRVETLPCSLRQFIFMNLNKDQIDQVVCGSNEGYNEIWWFYPSANSQVNDSYVIFNHLERIWYYGTINRTAWLDSPLRSYPLGAFSIQTSYLNADINSSVTSIALVDGTSYPNSGTVTIESEQITYTGVSNNTLTGCVRGANNTTAASHSQYTAVPYYVPNQVMQHENGNDDGSVSPSLPIDAYVESSDFDIGDGHNFGFVWRILPDITFANSTATQTHPSAIFSVKARQNSGTPYNSNGTPTVTQTASYPVELYTGQVYTRIRGRQMAFRVESGELGVAWQLGTPRIDIRPDGRR